MKIQRNHIYLANLDPRFGSEPGKKRPVVVVQTDLLNEVHPSTIICPITTNVIKKTSILRVYLLKNETNLKKNSDILVDQIRTIDNRRFIKKIGKLSLKHSEQLSENLKILLFE